jgi:RimJ/RimL family protein N-acetyltransferase
MRIVTDRKAESEQWLSQKTNCPPLDESAQYVTLLRGDKIEAVCGYDDFNGASVRAHIAIDGQVNREFLWFIFYYPFEQLRVKKMIAAVHGLNEKCVRFCEKLGFVQEAKITNVFPDGDLLFLTLTKEKSKMLTVRRP